MDIGFAGNGRNGGKTSGIAIGDSEPKVVHFGELGKTITREAMGGSPLNLLIEAPLSVAFDSEGRPVGRKIETRGMNSRYWYVGPGAVTMVAAMYLLNQIRCRSHESNIQELRLFEGFVSFKSKESKLSHSEDVVCLRRVIKRECGNGMIIGRDGLKMRDSHVLQSAFLVSGWDYGIPAVVAVGNGGHLDHAQMP